MIGPQPTWVDRYADGPVAFVYSGEASWSGGSPAWVYVFWNSRIDRVYVVNNATVYGPLPVEAAALGPDHAIHLSDRTSRPPPPFAVAGSGVVLARDANRHLGERRVDALAAARQPARRGCRLKRGDTAQAYSSDPGVVSSSPVSSHVFRPERIIGQPP